MEFLSSNNMNESYDSLFMQQNHLNPKNVTFRNNPSGISTAIDEHLTMLNTPNSTQLYCNMNNFSFTNPIHNGCLNAQQVLSQYFSHTSNNIFKTNMNSEIFHSFHPNNYPLQLEIDKIREQQKSLTNTKLMDHPSNAAYDRIVYHSVEDCIIDENNLYSNIHVLNADETKQTKIVVIPTGVYGKYLEPILDQIKDRLFNHQNNHTDKPLVTFDQREISMDNRLCETKSLQRMPVYHQEEEVLDSDEGFSPQDDKLSTIESCVGMKNSNNNYNKTNNKKGIKKKRKYIKSGLYRKDKNGNFLFSSVDRSRLATLIITTPGSTNQEIEMLELSSNTQNQNTSPSTISNNDFNKEDSLGFELYCRETVPLHRDAASNTLLLKEQWRVLPQEERDRYKRSVVMGILNLSQDFSNSELFTQLDDFSEMTKDNNGKYSRIKRPLNAYNIFCKIHFPEFQQLYSGFTINQISKLIGEKWKSLSIDEKQPYIDKSKYSQPVVKKPLNSYNLYCKQNFELFKKKYPDLSIHLLSRKVADSWKKLSEEEKRTYYEVALKQRQENLFQVQQSISTTSKRQL